MIYAEARDIIRSGDVIALTHNRWGSWYDLQVMAVRLFTMSEFTHVGVCWRVGGRVFVLHAVGAGVVITPLSHEVPFYWMPVGRWTAEAEEWALSRVGDQYSKWQAIKAFFGRTTPGKDRAWQCAEFASVLLNIAGLGIGHDALTPAKLINRLLEKGCPIHLVEEKEEQ